MKYKIIFENSKGTRVKYSKYKSSGYGILKPYSADFWYDHLNNKWLEKIPDNYSGTYMSNRCNYPIMLSLKSVIRRIKKWKPKKGEIFFCGNKQCGSNFTLIIK